MILVLEDRYESPLSIDTKKVPVALHLTIFTTNPKNMRFWWEFWLIVKGNDY